MSDGVELLPPAQARVLAAVSWLHDSSPFPITVRRVRDAAGLRSSATAFKHLCELRRRGLVTWDSGRAATLRPTFVVHPLPQ